MLVALWSGFDRGDIFADKRNSFAQFRYFRSYLGEHGEIRFSRPSVTLNSALCSRDDGRAEDANGAVTACVLLLWASRLDRFMKMARIFPRTAKWYWFLRSGKIAARSDGRSGSVVSLSVEQLNDSADKNTILTRVGALHTFHWGSLVCSLLLNCIELQFSGYLCLTFEFWLFAIRHLAVSYYFIFTVLSTSRLLLHSNTSIFYLHIYIYFYFYIYIYIYIYILFKYI